ncbi:unnamed protein product [Rotaria magnacalcarata]|uniref:Tripartite motif-containing protein 2 n=1 Tax=Rotaria magnacalcarata TaxID=392030 RepID=A0A817AYF9_9BILA|nr:unnamed protein product [Rotaria magnacalcarata]CAF4012948.1 unnamed protein product [Rotaria magnacalcarata]
MESDLTKRRPSIIAGCLPGVPAGWTPSVDTVEEDESDNEENEISKSYSSPLVSYLPPITNYETKPYLTIKKFQYENPSSGQTTSMSMAHTHGVCILNTEEEEIIACDYYHNRLLMFDSNKDGRLLEIFRGGLSTPESVTPRPHHRQHIYVTKAHSLLLYDLEKKKVVQQLGTSESGHANNRFNLPRGITVDPTTGEIYMCDTWNHRVCVFSPDFRFVNRRWYLTRWEQTQFKVKPSFIAINQNNQCVVTCDDAPNYRGAVYLFDKMGYIKKIYDHDSRKSPNVEAKLNVPHGILLDDEGNWLTVCYSDPESRSVERRSTFQDSEETEIINYWRCKELKGPSGLAIKRDQTLIIGDRDNNSINFFKQKAESKDEATK